jgi:hypothetical protein
MLQGLYKQMVETFRNLGVEAVPGVGHPFDPNFHEAIVSEPNDDVPDGTVLQEFRKGFQCGDRLIRPAMVKVHTLQLNTSFLHTSKHLHNVITLFLLSPDVSEFRFSV